MRIILYIPDRLVQRKAFKKDAYFSTPIIEVRLIKDVGCGVDCYYMP